MPVILFILVLVLIGCAAWLLTTYVPMAAPVKTAITVITIVIIVLLALHALGLTTLGPNVPKFN